MHDVKELPIKKILGSVQESLRLAVALRADHHVVQPFMLPHLGVAEVIRGNTAGGLDHGIALVLGKVHTVFADGYVLCLHKAIAMVGGAGVRHVQLAVLLDGAAREASALGVVVVWLAGRQRHRQLGPVQQVVADRMAPMHLSPEPAIRVELVEEMVLAPVIDQTIGVVDPAARPHKMIGLAHTGLCYLGGVFGDIGRGRIDGLLHGLCCHGNSPWSLNG